MFSFFKKKEQTIVEEKKENVDDLKDLFSSTVSAILTAIETKGLFSAGRNNRITHYSVLLAEKLNLPLSELSKIETATLLHDVGMIGIPDEVLYKKDELTSEERSQIQNHVNAGIKILNDIVLLKDVIPIIKHHHEFWNGQGYPAGISGDDIPVGSRIIAIVDAFDAMLSERPYRKAFSYQEALDELRKHSGIQFDPKLVELFSTIDYNMNIGVEAVEPDAYQLE